MFSLCSYKKQPVKKVEQNIGACLAQIRPGVPAIVRMVINGTTRNKPKTLAATQACGRHAVCNVSTVYNI